MTLRERIADWLTGGRHDTLGQEAAEHEAALYRAHAVMWSEQATQNGDACHRMEAALRAIAACETAGANATVRRMAKMAREAVK